MNPGELFFVNWVKKGHSILEKLCLVPLLCSMTFSELSQSVLLGESRFLNLDVIKIEDPYTHPELEITRHSDDMA